VPKQARRRARLARVIPWLGPRDRFPPVESALRDPNGLLAAGGDLSTERLLEAYGRGIFPWFGEGDPLLWWSPDPRMVLLVAELHVSRSLRRTMRSGRFRVTADTAFREVMEGCAAPRAGRAGTWITPVMIEAYGRLAALGYAHSVEVWEGDALAGGLYGVAIGRMFYGESMFTRRTDASKVAVAVLARQLERWGFTMIDCQMSTAHLASLGAREVSRRRFLDQVRHLVHQPPVPSPWRLERDALSTM
jgi:leucyl/phenylalanyl-tRNA--protein transferase